MQCFRRFFHRLLSNNLHTYVYYVLNRNASTRNDFVPYLRYHNLVISVSGLTDEQIGEDVEQESENTSN